MNRSIRDLTDPTMVNVELMQKDFSPITREIHFWPLLNLYVIVIIASVSYLRQL